ncbi:CoA transferase [Deinococcus sp. VB142]|uniref:CoA transferase n=1 Tax=Deinococcus sp. VB142 TaxID=3112952 RepID=A0AAU6Q7D6_9DEIO
MSTPSSALAGLNAVTLAGNIPGPLAAAALVRDGMHMTKVEGPGGDLLRQAHPDLYAELSVGQTVQTLDLRSADGQTAFQALLKDADLLLTSQRPAALSRLGITPEGLAVLNPRLCWVAIVGDTEEPEVPGHDLTYQLGAGLLSPPQMPRTLLADIAGGQEAARAAVTLLLGRERGSQERYRQVGLRQSAEHFALPLHFGLTSEGGWLSGKLPNYRLYPLKDGWVGVAALEPHFAQRLMTVLAGRDPEGVLSELTVEECNRLAHEHDLPLHAISTPDSSSGPVSTPGGQA